VVGIASAVACLTATPVRLAEVNAYPRGLRLGEGRAKQISHYQKTPLPDMGEEGF